MTATHAEPQAPPTEVWFDSGGTRCAAWHFPAARVGGASAEGRPALVMAHGLAGTKDSGLEPFARAFAAAGLEVLAFDYRGFGASEGEPRQRVRIEDQVADFHAAVAAAKALPGVDPGRIALWGVSLAGGHVLRVAAERAITQRASCDVAAVVSVVPMVDGIAAARHALASHSAATLLRATGRGIRARVADRLSSRFGTAAVMMPVVGRPGEAGALTLPGAYEDYLSIAGPTWRNEIRADVGLELGGRKPAALAKQITAPVLAQIADFDLSAPPHAAATAAFKARAEVRHYPGDHFDLFAGKPWHDAAIRHAVGFLTRTLSLENADD